VAGARSHNERSAARTHTEKDHIKIHTRAHWRNIFRANAHPGRSEKRLRQLVNERGEKKYTSRCQRRVFTFIITIAALVGIIIIVTYNTTRSCRRLQWLEIVHERVRVAH
jgi:hypothetical protein